MTPDVPPEITNTLVGRYGVPAVLISLVWWAAPKIWKWISARLSIAGQQNDLTSAGLGGMNDVVSTLRGQIADLTQQFRDVDQKLKDMSVTLDQAVAAKMLAEQQAAKATSDLYAVQLLVERLQAQVRSLGAVPVQ